MKHIRHFRWWVASLLACASALSYLDRQSFPVAIVEIQKHIPISDRQYSVLQMLFLLSYSTMYAGGGRIADWLGTRRSYSLLIVFWSLATGVHGMVSSVVGLGVARFFLGLGEGGGFPCAAKAVSEWFSPEDRALAFGIFNTGSSIGAVVAPPLIATIILTLSWRWIFFLTGLTGVGWALVWWSVYRTPADMQFVAPASPGPMRSALVLAQPATPAMSWKQLFQYRQVWALLVAKALTDAVWFFFIFWLPKYLADVRQLNIKQIGYYAWIPFALAGAGSFAGGWLSSVMVRRHVTLNRSRKVCLGLSALLMPGSWLIARSPLGMTVALFSIVLFGHQFWSTILQTLAADLFPSSVVGSVAGLMGAIGSFGAMAFDLLVGQVLTISHSYSLVLLLSGVFHPVAFLVILLWIPRIQLISVEVT